MFRKSPHSSARPAEKWLKCEVEIRNHSRNHTATVKESLDGSYLYTIDLKKLKRLKDMNVSASNELFTPKELGFIRNFRKIYPGIAQLQFNTSLASVTEHGKVRVCIFTPNELCVACCLCVFSVLFWICVAFIILFFSTSAIPAVGLK